LKRNGAFEDSPIAYYEGGNGVDELAAEIIKRKNKSFFKKLAK
jgi:hypothetical protein